MPEKETISKTLHDLYETLGLPVDSIDSRRDRSHYLLSPARQNLKGVLIELPFFLLNLVIIYLQHPFAKNKLKLKAFILIVIV